jgi:NAD-dependent dihydropyrimidine dehydrogenase PreA subunit
MTYIITDECIGCGVCEIYCKNEAITESEARKYVIDSARCDACGTCIEYCPIDGAIVEG